MTRPQHLNCVNTAQGIRRINEEQDRYNQDPEAYEAYEIAQREEQNRKDMEYHEQCQMEAEQMAEERLEY